MTYANIKRFFSRCSFPDGKFKNVVHVCQAFFKEFTSLIIASLEKENTVIQMGFLFT